MVASLRTPTRGTSTSLAWEKVVGKTSLTYGVPQGCVVRNTFLEWQECECVSRGKHPNETENTLVSLKPERIIRRSRSCPEQVISVQAHLSYDICEPGGVAGAVSCKEEESQGKVSTAWGDDSPTPTEASGSNGHDEDDHSDDLRVDPVPWRSKSQQERENSDPDKGKWSSAAFLSGKSSPKSGFGRDTEPKGKSKGCLRDLEGGTGGKNTLILRGLPFQTTEEDVYNFVEENGCKRWLAPGAHPIALLVNSTGRASGFAEISLGRQADFGEVRAKLHQQYMGSRYVEVLPPKTIPLGALSSGRSDRNDRDRDYRHDRYDRNDRRGDRTSRSWRR